MRFSEAAFEYENVVVVAVVLGVVVDVVVDVGAVFGLWVDCVSAWVWV